MLIETGAYNAVLTTYSLRAAAACFVQALGVCDLVSREPLAGTQRTYLVHSAACAFASNPTRARRCRQVARRKRPTAA
ncbi:hypothetical protein VTO73DRAFT_7725 [Trametes versicolor]